MKKIYIVYELEEDTKDLNYKFEFDKLKDCAKWLDVDYSNINKYVVNDIEKINCKLKEDKYFIFKELLKK